MNRCSVAISATPNVSSGVRQRLPLACGGRAAGGWRHGIRERDDAIEQKQLATLLPAGKGLLDYWQRQGSRAVAKYTYGADYEAKRPIWGQLLLEWCTKQNR